MLDRFSNFNFIFVKLLNLKKCLRDIFRFYSIENIYLLIVSNGSCVYVRVCENFIDIKSTYLLVYLSIYIFLKSIY